MFRKYKAKEDAEKCRYSNKPEKQVIKYILQLERHKQFLQKI